MRLTDFKRAVIVVTAGCCATALMTGCGSSRVSAPSAASAREALDSALGTWQKGGNAEALATAAPRVQVFDSQWRSGQTLEGYEILEEEPAERDVEKRYAVRLKLKKPVGEKRVQYIIIGREPALVFRDEDYANASTMGDAQPKKRPARRR